jgi:hypothetical protein
MLVLNIACRHLRRASPTLTLVAFGFRSFAVAAQSQSNATSPVKKKVKQSVQSLVLTPNKKKEPQTPKEALEFIKASAKCKFEERYAIDFAE